MTTARNTITNANIAPRVCLSYARYDEESFATQLRQRLEAEHIPLWQDRVGLEGGRDWWLQIVEALDRVQPFCRIAEHISEEVREILAALEAAAELLTLRRDAIRVIDGTATIEPATE